MKALVYNPRSISWMACKVLGRLWPGAFTSRVSGLRYCEVPTPELPTDQWVRLRTLIGGICGTDLGMIFQRNHPATILQALTSFPIILGHENVAVVDAVGPSVSGWRVGQRVCVEPALSCSVRGVDPPCRACAGGYFALCENIIGGELPDGTMLGLNNFTSGSWAPFFVAHQSQLQAVPDELDDATAVLVDPLACALHAALRRLPEAGERVLIVGGGIIGLGIAACLRALDCSCPITAMVRHEYQAERMRAAGVERVLVSPRSDSAADRYERVAAAADGRRITSRFGHQGMIGGFDVAYDCVGTGQSLTDCMNFVRARGTVIEVGTAQISLMDPTSLWMSELTVLGAFGRQFEHHDGERRHTYQLVFDLLTSGRLNVDGWLSRTYRPNEYRQAFADLSSPGRSRIIKAAFVHPTPSA